MAKRKHGRHAAAFILLSLAQGPNHGLGIKNKIDDLIPHNRMDTAIIYRTLKTFEKEGLALSSWKESEAGPQKKVYTITEKGLEKLGEYKEDIEKRIQNLTTFLTVYDSLQD